MCSAVRKLEVRGRFEFMSEFDESLYELLANNIVIDAMRGGKKKELEVLIKQESEENLYENQQFVSSALMEQESLEPLESRQS